MLLLLVKGLLGFYLLNRISAFLRAKVNFSKHLPLLITPMMSPLGFLLPKSSFYRVLGFNWDERHTLYENAPLNTVVIAPVVTGDTTILSRNLDSLYQSLSLGSDFHKGQNKGLELLGDNVLTTIGHDWKRHRRITAPAFNHLTYRNVWDTTAQVYADMLNKEGWTNVDDTGVTNINKATHKLALFLIAIVGFGIPMSWDEPARDENGKLTPHKMIFDIATYIMERMVTPRWMYHLGIEKLNQIDEAYNRFEEFMHERITEAEIELQKIRDTEGGEARLANTLNSIFKRLVNARLSEGKNSLTDREIIGNCFAFTFAGHETSANALAATLGLLALYQEEQEWVYQSIISVIGDREPTFDDFDNLDGVMACFFEGLRLFPPGYMLFKVASKDTTLSLSRRDNPEVKEVVPVKKGTGLLLDIVGMCYDPQVFPDPEIFNPRRWKKSGQNSSSVPTGKAVQADEITGTSPVTTLEGFIAFAYGPRTCIGHKFAKVESVAFLTLLLKDWCVVPVMREGESREAWKERVLKPGFGQALLMGEVPVRLIKRKD